MRIALQKVLPHLSVFAVLLALALLFLWPLPLDGAAQIIGGGGDPLLELWTLCWNDHWFSGQAPSYFDANICHPEKNSLAFADHLFSQALIFAPLYRITGNPVLSYNLLLVLTLTLSGFGAYLCAGALGLSRPVSLVVGILFAFYPFRTAQIVHLHILSTQWLPFSFYFLLGFLRSGGVSRRRLSLFTIFSILHILCSFYQALVWALLVAITVIGFVAGGRMGWRKIAALLCSALLIGAALAPFASAYFEVSRHYQIVRSVRENVKFSARPDDFVHTSHFSLLYRCFTRWKNDPPATRIRTGEHQLYPGLLFTVLLLGGVVAVFKRKQISGSRPPGSSGTAVAGQAPPGTGQQTGPAIDQDGREARLVWILLLATALAAIVFSFGPGIAWRSGGEERFLPLPYSLLYHWLPGIKGLRVPSRLVLLFHFSGALLAGLGLQTWLFNKSRAWVWSAVPLISLLVFLEGVSFDLPVKALPLPSSMPAVYRDIREMPADTVLLELPTHASWHQYLPMYTSSFHFHSLANGRSGIIPPVTSKMHQLTDPANPYAIGPALLEQMLDTGINTVLLHRNWNDRRTNQVTLNRLFGLDCFKIVGRYENLDILFRLAAKAGREDSVTVLDAAPVMPLPAGRILLEAADAYPPTQHRDLLLEVRGDTLHLGEQLYICWLARLPEGLWQLRLHASGLDHPDNAGQPVLLWAKVAGHQVLEERQIGQAENIQAAAVHISEAGYYRISAFVQARQPGALLNIELDRVRLVPLALDEDEPSAAGRNSDKRTGSPSRTIQ
jgi:hypothetical protein